MRRAVGQVHAHEGEAATEGGAGGGARADAADGEGAQAGQEKEEAPRAETALERARRILMDGGLGCAPARPRAAACGQALETAPETALEMALAAVLSEKIESLSTCVCVS